MGRPRSQIFGLCATWDRHSDYLAFEGFDLYTPLYLWQPLYTPTLCVLL